MRPIEMIASFNTEGILTPIKYKIIDDGGESAAVKVDNVLTRSEEKVAGVRSVIFRCKSVVDGVQRVFELKYELDV